MTTCCEKCKPVGHPGKIGTPFCAKFGKCECHTTQQNEAEWNFDKEFDDAIRPFARDCELYLVPNINLQNKFWAVERKTEEVKAFIKERYVSRAQIAEVVEGMRWRFIAGRDGEQNKAIVAKTGAIRVVSENAERIVNDHNAALEAVREKLLGNEGK